jgi:hypothetical protein
MAESYIILGAGGLARELYQNLREKNARAYKKGRESLDCAGFLDDVKTEMPAGYPSIIGKIEGHRPTSEYCYYLGVGIPEVRRRIAERFHGFERFFPGWHSYRDDEWLAARSVILGYGSLIEQGQVSCDVRIGNFALVSGVIGHDVQIGDYCEVAPGAAVSGGTILEEGVHLGANSVTAPGVRIGAWSKVSAGSAVMEDVPPCSFVVGVPGKVYEEFFLPPGKDVN